MTNHKKHVFHETKINDEIWQLLWHVRRTPHRGVTQRTVVKLIMGNVFVFA